MAKVIVVDDALFMRRMLSDILTKEGHEVIGEAENAKEAIEPAPEILQNQLRADTLRGIAKQGQRLVVVLDLNHLLVKNG